MGLTWDSRGCPFRHPPGGGGGGGARVAHDLFNGGPWVPHGTPMVLPWDTHKIHPKRVPK